jgi:hypothetical protein
MWNENRTGRYDRITGDRITKKVREEVSKVKFKLRLKTEISIQQKNADTS